MADASAPVFHATPQIRERVYERAGQLRHRRWSIQAAAGAVGLALVAAVLVVAPPTGGGGTRVTTAPPTSARDLAHYLLAAAQVERLGWGLRVEHAKHGGGDYSVPTPAELHMPDGTLPTTFPLGLAKTVVSRQWAGAPLGSQPPAPWPDRIGSLTEIAARFDSTSDARAFIDALTRMADAGIGNGVPPLPKMPVDVQVPGAVGWSIPITARQNVYAPVYAGGYREMVVVSRGRYVFWLDLIAGGTRPREQEAKTLARLQGATLESLAEAPSPQ